MLLSRAGFADADDVSCVWIQDIIKVKNVKMNEKSRIVLLFFEILNELKVLLIMLDENLWVFFARYFYFTLSSFVESSENRVVNYDIIARYICFELNHAGSPGRNQCRLYVFV